MEVCMDIGAVFEITVAALAVFGLVSLLRFAGVSLFRPQNVFLAAAILDPESARDADLLIRIIRSESEGECYLLIGEDMLGDTELMELVEGSNIRYFIVKK